MMIPLSGMAQDRITQFVQAEPVIIDRLEMMDDVNHIYIPASFGNYDLATKAVADELKNRTIYKVQLVYTSYRTVANFDQVTLNRRRCEELNKAIPFLFENDLIELELVEQTGCTSRKEGADYFHGIVIICGEEQSEELSKKEMEFLDALFEGKDAECPVKLNGEEEVFVTKPGDRLPFYSEGEDAMINMMSSSIKYPMDAVSARVYGESKVKIEIKADGKLGRVSVSADSPIIFTPEIISGVKQMTRLEPAITDGKFIGSTVDIIVKFSYSDKSAVVVDVTFSDLPFPDDETGVVLDADGKVLSTISMSTNEVKNTLTKNDWNDIVIVADVTGSMSPYTGQLILFLQSAIKEQQVKNVVFFNDGDNKPTMLKVVGKTGGVYSTNADNIMDVKVTLRTAMENGSGGETPESDLEAVLEAQDVCPDCSSIVLVADNYAEVRDIKLLKKIEKPVHVIVCNMSKGLREEYLNIAYATGGSIHVRGEDYVDLEQYTKENPLTIGGIAYYLKNGRFMLDKATLGKAHPMVKS